MSKKKKKQYYIVIKGHKPGLYKVWFGGNGAAEQVQGITAAPKPSAVQQVNLAGSSSSGA